MKTAPNDLWQRIRAAERSAEQSADRSGSGERPLVLLVEGDPQTRLFAQDALRFDCRVDTAATAADALRMTEETAYDGLLVGVTLPDATGLIVLKRLRFRAAYRKVPMIALSAHAVPGDRERLVSAGFDAYVTKPYSRGALRAEVCGALPTSSHSLRKAS